MGSQFRQYVYIVSGNKIREFNDEITTKIRSEICEMHCIQLLKCGGRHCAIGMGNITFRTSSTEHSVIF